MLNNNNFSVESIVAKYVTIIKTQWEATSEYKDLCLLGLPPEMDFAFAPHQQLLATIWSIVNNNPKEEISLESLQITLISSKEIYLRKKNYHFL